jgi:hypothetical protein
MSTLIIVRVIKVSVMSVAVVDAIAVYQTGTEAKVQGYDGRTS